MFYKTELLKRKHGKDWAKLVRPIITWHGNKRMEDRFNMERDNIYTVVMRALNFGIVQTFDSNKNRKHYYGDMTFVFSGKKLLTAYKTELENEVKYRDEIRNKMKEMVTV
jgi:Mg2+ and Co2+ transporter CorA